MPPGLSTRAISRTTARVVLHVLQHFRAHHPVERPVAKRQLGAIAQQPSLSRPVRLRDPRPGAESAARRPTPRCGSQRPHAGPGSRTPRRPPDRGCGARAWRARILRNGLDPTAIGKVSNVGQNVGEPLPRSQRRSRFSGVVHVRRWRATDAESSLLPIHKVRCLTVHSLPVSALDP